MFVFFSESFFDVFAINTASFPLGPLTVLLSGAVCKSSNTKSSQGISFRIVFIFLEPLCLELEVLIWPNDLHILTYLVGCSDANIRNLQKERLFVAVECVIKETPGFWSKFGYVVLTLQVADR